MCLVTQLETHQKKCSNVTGEMTFGAQSIKIQGTLKEGPSVVYIR